MRGTRIFSFYLQNMFKSYEKNVRENLSIRVKIQHNSITMNGFTNSTYYWNGQCDLTTYLLLINNTYLVLLIFI